MEYGRISNTGFDALETQLPPDASANAIILQPNGAKPKLYMGCPMWGRKEWIGQIYPKGSRDNSLLDHYVKLYNAVELNATHYNLLGRERIEEWVKAAMGRDFRFCPKVWKQISHYSGFENADAITHQFLDEISAFKDHLGPLFLQTSDKFRPKHAKDKFFNYLQTWPKQVQLFVELRHPEWFSDTIFRKELFDCLRTYKIGAVITDTPAFRERLHMELTIPKAFIRFLCKGDHPSDTKRIDAWALRIKQWMDKGIEEVYFFVHPMETSYSPALTKYAAAQFNKVCGAQLPEIRLQTLW